MRFKPLILESATLEKPRNDLSADKSCKLFCFFDRQPFYLCIPFIPLYTPPIEDLHLSNFESDRIKNIILEDDQFLFVLENQTVSLVNPYSMGTAYPFLQAYLPGNVDGYKNAPMGSLPMKVTAEDRPNWWSKFMLNHRTGYVGIRPSHYEFASIFNLDHMVSVQPMLKQTGKNFEWSFKV